MLSWFIRKITAWVSRMPLDKALRVGRRLGWLYGHVLRHRRRYVLETLAWALPEKTEEERVQIANDMYELQVVNIIELFRMIGREDDESCTLLSAQNEDIVREAHARGKGVLILIAHYGNFDLMGLAAVRIFKYPLAIVTKMLKNKAINDFWHSSRARFGTTVIPSHNAYRACVRALKQNSLVGFMLDQNRPGSQGVFVDFFGRPASTTPGLAFMAAQTGAPVVPVFMQRQDNGRHILEVLPAIEPPPDRKEETILEYTQLYTKILEDKIRERPEQWLWVHKRWKTRPPEAATPPVAAPSIENESADTP